MGWPKGKPAPNRGRPHTEETKRKISESCKKAGVGRWKIGCIGRPKVAEETILKQIIFHED